MIRNYHHVFFVAFVFLASSCGVAQVISPTATSTLKPTPAPTQTPTPLSEIPFGVTYEGSLWRAGLHDLSLTADERPQDGTLQANPGRRGL